MVVSLININSDVYDIIVKNNSRYVNNDVFDNHHLKLSFMKLSFMKLSLNDGCRKNRY